MGHKPRYRPQRLAAKLLQIRHGLGLSQSQLVNQLKAGFSTARISEYEGGSREPNLLTLLAYARVARVRVEILIDDKLELPERLKQNSAS